MVDAKQENFEIVELDGRLALFTNARIYRKTVHKNLHCYDIRHDDECQGTTCEVAPNIMVNHWGTILLRHDIPLDNGSYYLKDDINYTGVEMNMETFVNTDEEKLKKEVYS